MKPERALELVQSYARLAKQMSGYRKVISAHLDKCELIECPFDKPKTFTWMSTPKITHLEHWYHLYIDESGSDYYAPNRSYGIEEDGSEETCPHCWAAHLLVQERKGVRLALGHVKRSMARLGAA